MARWAKSLNQKKDYSRQPISCDVPGIQNGTSAASADIGFAVLEKKTATATMTSPPLNVVSPVRKPESALIPKVS